MRARLIKMCIILVILTFSNGISNAEKSNNYKVLSLDEALSIAMSNAQSIKLSELNLKNSLVALKEARSNHKNLMSETYELTLTKDTIIPKAESGQRIAEKSLEYTKSIVKFDVEGKYYALLKAQKSLEIAEDSKVRAEKLMKDVQANFDAGIISNKEVLGTKVQVAQQEAMVIAAEQQEKAAEMALNKAVGLPLTTHLELSTNFSFSPNQILELEKNIIDAMYSRFDLLQEREKLDMAELEFEVTKKFYTPNVYKYKHIELAYQEANVNYDKAIIDAEERIRLTYNNISSAEEQFKVLNQSISYAEESLRLNELKYSVGLQTEVEVMNDQITLRKAKADALAALYDYNLAKLQYELAITTGM